MRAADELVAICEYDYVVMNDDLVVAVAQVAAILEAETRRVSRQDTLMEFVERFRRDVIAAATVLPSGNPNGNL
jgi:guanylate kinase